MRVRVDHNHDLAELGHSIFRDFDFEELALFGVDATDLVLLVNAFEVIQHLLSLLLLPIA